MFAISVRQMFDFSLLANSNLVGALFRFITALPVLDKLRGLLHFLAASTTFNLKCGAFCGHRKSIGKLQLEWVCQLWIRCFKHYFLSSFLLLQAN